MSKRYRNIIIISPDRESINFGRSQLAAEFEANILRYATNLNCKIEPYDKFTHYIVTNTSEAFHDLSSYISNLEYHNSSIAISLNGKKFTTLWNCDDIIHKHWTDIVRLLILHSGKVSVKEIVFEYTTLDFSKIDDLLSFLKDFSKEFK